MQQCTDMERYMSKYAVIPTLLFFIAAAYSQEQCNPSSIKDRYYDRGTEVQKFIYSKYDEQLSEDARNRGASGMYSGFSLTLTQNDQRRSQIMSESSLGITQQEWRDFATWYWSNDALVAYQSCLAAFSRVAGLHSKVVRADAREVSIQVRYLAGPNDPRNSALEISTLRGGSVVESLPPVQSGAGTVDVTVRLSREWRKPLEVQFRAGKYVSDPVAVPPYIKIVSTSTSQPFSSAEVRAYCPHGGAVETRQCFDAPDGGRFVDTTAEISINRDYGGNPHRAQVVEVNQISETRLCVRSYCYPQSKRGAMIVGRARASIITTVHEKQYE